MAQRYITGFIGLCLACLIAASAAAEVRDPFGVAVIVGNHDYAHERVPDVAYADRDAAAFKAYVLDVLGYTPDNIIDLRNATQAQIESAFGNDRTNEGRLWRYLDPQGRSDVVVFYSGHGVPGLKDKRGYLLPVDGDPDTAEINGYPIDLLYENLSTLKEARSVRVFIDACFSGDSAQGMLVQSASPVFVQARLPGDVGALTVLTAASAGEVASWDKDARHGMFTEHLLAALYGAADSDGDGKVKASEAMRYLDEHMTVSARRTFGRYQNASLNGNADTVLAAVSGTGFPDRPRDLAAVSPGLPSAPSAPDGAAVETALQLARADKVLIQRGLNSLQLDAGPADGLFGPKTRSAIRAWQGEKGFAATGYLDGPQAQALVASGREVAVASAAPTPPSPVSSRSASEPQVAVGVFPKRYQPGDKFRDCADCPEMVVVPAGSFRMGDLAGGGFAREKPEHDVRIGQPFAAGVYEVTFAEWDACVADGGCRGYRPDDQGWGRGNRPVMNVNWDDAQSYVTWLSGKTGERYRLLSESEWEYVARAGSSSKYHFGSSEGDLCGYGNGADQMTQSEFSWSNGACSDGYSKTSPVGSFAGNAFGLHDVYGNVMEWTEDCMHDSYAGAPSDGSAWMQGGECGSQGVFRGGSWVSSPSGLRSATRYYFTTDKRGDAGGFRLARALLTP